MFRQYPYINLSDLNLDWILQKIKEVETELNTYLNNSVITFADPITWNITNQYTAMTVVIDSDGTAYLSKQPVPAGVDISNTDYWLPIFNYDDNINTLRSQIAYNAGESATTGQTLAAGSLVFWKGTLYIVTADMAAGTAFIDGTNITAYTVDHKIDDVVTVFGNQITNINNDITDINADIIDLQNQITALNQNVRYVTPFDFGAEGDGITDDTIPFQAAIEEAERTGAILLVPDADFLVSTLWINDNINITGSGRIRGHALRYDINTASISAGSNSITVTDGSIYRVNMILTVTDSSHSDIMVVTAISGNVLTVKRFRYYDGQEGHDYFKYSYAAGSNIHINTVPLVITKHIYTVDVETDASVYQIDRVTMFGVSIIGNRSGYESAKYSIYDIVFNGCVFAHIVKNVTIMNGEFGNCYNNALQFNGRCENITFINNEVHDVIMPDDITDVAIKDSAGGLLLHWDQRTQDANDYTSHFNISKNHITNCYNGLFISAARYGAISDNQIMNCSHHGIELYSGDLGFGTYDVTVTGNVINGTTNGVETHGSAIGLTGATRIDISNNAIQGGEMGLEATLCYNILFANNQIVGTSYKSVFIGRVDGKLCNNIIASSPGSIATVEIDNDTAYPINMLVFSGNYYDGTNSRVSAISVIAGQNIYSIDEISKIRCMFFLETTVQASDNINAVRDYIPVASSYIATTGTARQILKQVDNYTLTAGIQISSTDVLSMPTASLANIVNPGKGSLVYDSTTSTLKVYNGSSWVNV